MLTRKFRETYFASSDDFGAMCQALLKRIPASKRVASLVFYGNPRDNSEYFMQWRILDEILCSIYPDSVPPFCYVAQKPVNGGLILEVCLFEKMAGQTIAYCQFSGMRYLTIQNEDCRELIIAGYDTDHTDESGESGDSVDTFQQASACFQKIVTIFSREKMPVNSIIRQWNYIADITGYSGQMQKYHQFNRARSNFYDAASWDNGYPAATGIGMTAGGVILRIEAMEVFSPSIINIAINNTLQVAAHRYSPDVLAGNDKTLYAPRFERARLLGSDGQEIIYYSGTAAIRGEKSMAENDAAEQTRITLENILNLNPGQTDPVFEILVIYLKYEEDFGVVKRVLEQTVDAVSTVYVVADLCREELLVEVEGVG
jgi:enamine deaminase RidA (YjgF/YER057c/UK114 family)